MFAFDDDAAVGGVVGIAGLCGGSCSSGGGCRGD